MRTPEILIVVIVANIILLILVGGIIAFVFQYRKRRKDYEKEKLLIEERHKLELLSTQLQAQEQTMQFIGREIHDSVAQKLTLATLHTHKLQLNYPNADVIEKVGKINDIISDSMEELRELSRSLTNNKIHETSFSDLVYFECGRINDTGLCKAEIQSNQQKPMSVTVKNFLLRIVQEFMQNSLKHSGCSLINIVISDNASGCVLEIADNGKGFDSSTQKVGGIGLQNMKRRVNLIGGEYHLLSEPGKGTKLRVSILDKDLGL